MIIRLIKILIFSFLIVLIQNSFVVALPGWLADTNLILLIIATGLMIFGLQTSLIWCFFMGIIWDMLSFTPFPLHTIVLLLTLLISHFLLVRFFTNRSLYSFVALNALAFGFYMIFIQTGLYLFEAVDISGLTAMLHLNFWILIGRGLVINTILVTMAFYFLNIFTKKLKPVFLGEQY